METITITTENHETYSAVSNFFIDYYMTEANGEFVKIYLYLIRLLNSGRAVTVADIADHFNLTQKDICRAIRYWIKQDVLRLEYTPDKVLTGITMLPLSAKKTEDDSSLLSMLGVTEETTTQKEHSETKSSRTESSEKTSQNISIVSKEIKEEKNLPKKPTFQPSFLEEKKEDEDFGNILYQTSVYFEKNLTQNDVNTLLYIYENLSFSPELLEYLVEYCVTIGKKNSRYIEAVAIDWYKKNIKTVEDAKIESKNYNSIYVAVLKQLGIPRKQPTTIECNYIDTWYNTYAFDKSIIIEACKRAITAKPHSANFQYVNGILEKWHKSNVRKFSDIEELDKQWEAEKKKKSTSNKTSTTNQFNNYQGSTKESVVTEFENLFLQETNQAL